MNEIMEIAEAKLDTILSLKIDSKEIQKRAETLPSKDLRKIYLQGKAFDRLVAGVMKGIKPVLLKRAETGGKEINGHFTLNVNGGVVERQRRQRKELNQEKALEFFKAKDMLDDVLTFYVDKEKVDKLLEREIITEEEYRALIDERDPIYALIVR